MTIFHTKPSPVSRDCAFPTRYQRPRHQFFSLRRDDGERSLSLRFYPFVLIQLLSNKMTILCPYLVARSRLSYYFPKRACVAVNDQAAGVLVIAVWEYCFLWERLQADSGGASQDGRGWSRTSA